ncbi:MAG TPA: oligosaccharide flippase family protein [Candidatus Aquilonibacter sp.]|nr:oligosaccharide flippase family protein [Candidatus Aquilonibacter sp.]
MKLIADLRSRLRTDRRLSSIFKGGLSSILQKICSVAISAVSIPLAVRYLGPQQYGIWITISSAVVMLSVMDLGIANTLTNMISRSFAHGDQREAQRYYATAYWISAAIAGVLGIVCFLVWPHVQWGALFKTTDPVLSHEISICVAIAVAFFLLSLPLNLVNRVLSGFQQTQITNYFNLLSSAMGLGAILVVMKIHGSLPVLMLMYSLALMTGTVVLNLWVNLWDRPWILPKPTAVDGGAIRGLLSSGMGFFLLQIAGLVVFNSDNLVISHYLGAVDVVPYSITWKVAGYASVLQASIFPSLWPAYAEAYERGDYRWVRRAFWTGTRLAMGAVAIAVTVLVLFGRPLIRWYAGPAAVPSEILLVAICGWTLMSTGMDLEACFLAAINRVRLQGALSVVAAGLNLALSIYLVKRIGSLGVILGTIISYTITLVVPQSWIVWRGLYHPPQRDTSVSTLAQPAEIAHGA